MPIAIVLANDIEGLPAQGCRVVAIVGGPGFTRTPPADRVVRADPRDATRKYGAKLCAEAVAKIVAMAKAGLAAAGSPQEA
jgi:hypothetical protein